MAERGTADPPGSAGVGGLAARLRDFVHLPGDVALARLSYGLKRPVFALPIYRYSLAGGGAMTLEVAPSDSWPGDAALGADIVKGSFCFDDRRITDPAPRWAPVGAAPEWLRVRLGG